MQLRPHPHIAHIVRHYLLLKGTLENECALRLFADGNTGIVFNLNETALRTTTAVAAQHRSWVYGQLSTYQDLVLHGAINWIIVVLQPYGAYQLWGGATNEWKNAFLPAHEVLGNSMHSISDRLLHTRSPQSAAALLDAWLIDLAWQHQLPDALLLKAIQHIQAGEGKLPIHYLLQQLQLNERMLERKFSTRIGISPKQYSGIVRVTASAKKIQRLQPGSNLTGIAYDSDYFDQAHFIKDFKKYTGITPWQYQHNTTPLALNFLRF